MACKRAIIPVQRADFSVLEREFNNMRERFDTEMRNMEQEMNKFINKEFGTFGSWSSSETVSACGSSCPNIGQCQQNSYMKIEDEINKLRESFKQDFDSFFKNTHSIFEKATSAPAIGAGPSCNNQMQLLSDLCSPLVQQDGNSKNLKLRFNLCGFKPEEVTVKTEGNKLLVHARHEENCEHQKMYKEYNRCFVLPSCTNPDCIKSSLSNDGVLTVEAPLPVTLPNSPQITN